MVRIGTPKDIEKYIVFNYDISSKIQEDSIFPIWRDDEFMYFEKTEEFFDYIRKEKLIDEGID
jgi:hypothetical protein